MFHRFDQSLDYLKQYLSFPNPQITERDVLIWISCARSIKELEIVVNLINPFYENNEMILDIEQIIQSLLNRGNSQNGISSGNFLIFTMNPLISIDIVYFSYGSNIWSVFYHGNKANHQTFDNEEELRTKLNGYKIVGPIPNEYELQYPKEIWDKFKNLY